MDLKKLAEVLNARRERIGIARAELARRAKLGRSTLWIYERGESPATGEPTRPAKDKLERLAAVLTFTPDERQQFLAELLELAGYEMLPTSITAQSASSETIPTMQRQRGILASPLIADQSDEDELESRVPPTVGQEIDAVIQRLSQADREQLREVLVPLASQLTQMITLSSGGRNEEETQRNSALQANL
jgi:transcriptional regulator with XRE-family HTH domain